MQRWHINKRKFLKKAFSVSLKKCISKQPHIRSKLGLVLNPDLILGQDKTEPMTYANTVQWYNDTFRNVGAPYDRPDSPKCRQLISPSTEQEQMLYKVYTVILNCLFKTKPPSNTLHYTKDC